MDYSILYDFIRNTTRLFAALMLVKYTIFLLAAPFHVVKESLRTRRIVKQRQGVPYQPLVSVMIPAWNEEVGILSTITSLLDNDYPHLEVIVVNDGSTDNTDRLVRRYQKEHAQYLASTGKALVYYRKENGGKGRALNYALERVKGDIVVTIDADSIADRQMVSCLVHYFADDSVDSAVGNVKVAGEVSFINLLQRLEYLFGFYHKRAHSVLGAEYIYGGACAAFRKATVFDQLGPFDTSSITEDIELSMRTRYNGRHAVYAHDAICYTEGASTTLGLIRQRLRWKKGRFEAFGKYKRMFFSTRARHNLGLSWFILPFALLAELQLLFEPIGVTLLMLYSLITGDYSSILLGALFIGIIYLVVGLFTERARNWWIIPLLPFTWMMFYALVWIEYVALLKSLAAMIRAEAVTWQKWQRKGIHTPVVSHQEEIVR